MKKERISMRQIYEDCAEVLRAGRGKEDATRCTVRCYCNDIMDGYERDGFLVHHAYSQERAFHAVLALL
jgi:hypothetical protein